VTKDGPRNSTTERGGSRSYTWPPTNEVFPSVTTVLSVLNKPALVGWAAKEVATYALENLGQLQVLNDKDPDGALALLKGSPYRKRNRAANLGSDVHRAVEAHVLEQPMPEWEPDVAPFMRQFEQFLLDVEPEFEATEATVYSREHGYAGTLDAIASVNQQRLVLDVKTGSGVYPEFALQLAAYARADFIGMPDGQEVAMPQIEGAAVLHLRPDAFELIPTRIDAEIFMTFLSALDLFKAKEQERSWIGRAMASGKAVLA
jgi:hypothetical protein